ncbi:MAG: hypothetical protein NUV93_03415 [Firmicutes bacterium]|jgi:hypothetical protein|nr:hypothetical protein [Bacillota bacterium]
MAGLPVRCKNLAVLFEGGQAPSRVERELSVVRKAACLDTIERLLAVPRVQGVVLVTSSRVLARQASALGAHCELARPAEFHFGMVLEELVRRFQPESVLCTAGASVPLAGTEEFDKIARHLEQNDEVVVTNNLVSSDIVAFKPASAVTRISPPRSDNFLAYLLWEAGLKPTLLGVGPAFGLDVDSPIDAVLAALHGGVGARMAAAVKRVGWRVARLDEALHRLGDKHCRVFLSGRVGPAVMAFISQDLRWRLRVVSEERGMKALGSDERNDVRSVVGELVDRMGPEEFFGYLGGVCDVAVMDTRVIYAHWRERVSQADRFNSDLGRARSVRNPRVRLFTRAAGECRIPVLLGGHCLVNGGMWVLAERCGRNLPREVECFL